jgi:hypothetical protein
MYSAGRLLIAAWRFTRRRRFAISVCAAGDELETASPLARSGAIDGTDEC